MWRKVLNSRLWVSAGVVVILTAALIGGGILVQKLGEQARAHNAEVAVQQSSKQNSDNSHNQSASGNTSQPTTDQGGSSTTPGASQNTDNNSGSSSTVPNSGQLPTTGPSNFVGTAFVLVALTFAVASYLSSLRAVSEL